MTNKNQTNTLALEQQLEQLEQQLEQLCKKEVPDDKEERLYFNREKSYLQDMIEMLEDRIENPDKTRNLSKEKLMKKVEEARNRSLNNQYSSPSLTTDTLQRFLSQKYSYDNIIETLQEMANIDIYKYDKNTYSILDQYHYDFNHTIEEILKEIGTDYLHKDNLITRLYHLYNDRTANEIAFYLDIDHKDIHY